MKIEVCVDNIESVVTATEYGADRLELCSALSSGGLTPTPGLVKAARKMSDLPLHCMIRPRAGDFIYSEQELQIMLDDINCLSKLGVQGFVFGTLTTQGKVNAAQLARLCEAAGEHNITFHRAFDYVREPEQALETIIQAGCNILLSSGLKASASEGLDTLVHLQRQAGERLTIMPGAGITPANIMQFADSYVSEWLHMSAKTQRQTQAEYLPEFSMGSNLQDDLAIVTTDGEQLDRAVKLLTQN